MSKYKESSDTVDKNTWNRASHIILWNSPIPKIEVHHEEKTVFSDGSSNSNYLGQLNYEMFDPSIEIPIIDPETYEQTEKTFTAGQFALFAASVYIWLDKNK